MAQLGIRDKNYRPNQYVHPMMIGAEPYSDRPLTPKEVEEKQRKQPGTSPWPPGKSPGPSRQTLSMDMKDAIPRGGFQGMTRTNIRVNDGGEAYIVEPDGNWKFDGFYDPVRHGPMFPGYVQNQINDDMKIAHHTGGKHFTEPSMNELIRGLINGDVPRGTLGDEETENRMIQEYLNKQNLKIGWVKNVGDTINVKELIEGMKIIDDTETNPLRKRLRQDRMINNNPLA